METIKQEVLNGIPDDLFSKKKPISAKIETYTFKDTLNLRKKKIRDIKINKVKNTLALIIDLLDDAISDYKELINRTEFWEKKSVIDYDFENWNTIKKVNGRIVRYYNDLLRVQKKLEEEK